MAELSKKSPDNGRFVCAGLVDLCGNVFKVGGFVEICLFFVVTFVKK